MKNQKSRVFIFMHNKFKKNGCLHIYEHNKRGRDFVCGDIHGMYSKLIGKMKEVSFDVKKDRLFSVGDLVDRGEENVEVLNFFINSDFFHSVVGNHEYLFEAKDPIYDNSVKLDYLTKINRSIHNDNGGEWTNNVEIKPYIFKEILSLPIAICIKNENRDDNVLITHSHPGIYDFEIFKKYMAQYENAFDFINNNLHGNKTIWDRDFSDRVRDYINLSENFKEGEFLTPCLDNKNEFLKEIFFMKNVNKHIMGHTVFFNTPINIGNSYFIETGAFNKHGLLTFMQV